jgi:uncharacterized protein (DUF1501 family)
MNELTRRRFFRKGAQGFGALALSQLMGAEGTGGLPHFPPKVKRAIYLHMVGAPPQLETFDYKPKMKEWFDKDLPDSIRQGQRLTTMTSGQSRFPIAPSVFEFKQHGQSGAWVSELLPYTAKMVDDIAIIRSMNTEAINHEPAITFMQTGFMIAGKPCIGSWIAYGLGSMNKDLPTFVVLNATHTHPKANVQAISARLWSSGFLSGQYAGVALRASGDPVLYINNPDGVTRDIRRKMLDGVAALNGMEHERWADPETRVRVEQYEMAFRMQASVPELTALDKEPESTYKLYGEDAKQSGTFAYSALMARRLVERGVRFVQIYHRGWDVHGNLPEILPSQCKDVDQASWALVQDLKQRGMLEDTLVVWGGEFGRTPMNEARGGSTFLGRDHNPQCFTLWLAGGGVKAGVVHGATDDFGYTITAGKVSVRDLQATILHMMGLDAHHLSYSYLGLRQRLIGPTDEARVIKALLA